jgi:hypothetical protein
MFRRRVGHQEFFRNRCHDIRGHRFDYFRDYRCDDIHNYWRDDDRDYWRDNHRDNWFDDNRNDRCDYWNDLRFDFWFDHCSNDGCDDYCDIYRDLGDRHLRSKHEYRFGWLRSGPIGRRASRRSLGAHGHGRERASNLVVGSEHRSFDLRGQTRHGVKRTVRAGRCRNICVLRRYRA